MKTYNKLILGALTVSTLALAGCKDRMVEMNTNPDTVLNADVAQLFVGATVKGKDERSYMSRYSGVMCLMQYLTRDNADETPYVNPLNPDGRAPGSWSDQYKKFFDDYSGQRLYNIVKWIDEQVNKDKYQDVKAICEILSVYQQWDILSSYGAIVYDEAFKGISNGITQPKYQKIQDLWQDLDRRLKVAVEILAKPAPGDVFQLGASDYYNGWTNTPNVDGGSANARVSSYAKQRGNWLKFGNMFRFEMAWMLAKVQPAHFETVKSEVVAVTDGLMTDISDGTYYHNAFDDGNNTDDLFNISKNYGPGEAMVNTLKRMNDPRLPYLARTNGLAPELSPSFLFMQTYYADTLAKYGDLFTGKNIFIGANSSPKNYNKGVFGDANFPTYVIKTFDNVPNRNYPNAMKVMFDGKEFIFCPENQATFNISLQIVSSSQGRYYVKCGGKGSHNGPVTNVSEAVNYYRLDGDGNEVYDKKWQLRRPIYTYAQQCFLFAITNTTAAGKTAAQWYAEGVKAAMQEIESDVYRYGIQVAVNPNFPAIPGTLLSTIPYKYDADAAAATIVNNYPYSEKEAMTQAWIYFYNNPEAMYKWWLRTGLIPVKTHATPQDAMADAEAYLEQPILSSNDKMEFPRRGCLPNRNNVNVNYNPMKAELEAQPDFGNWTNTAGRIWWDKK